MSHYRYLWALRVRGTSAYFCGYSLAASVFSGNWWWMLAWLALPIGAVIEGALEASK